MTEPPSSQFPASAPARQARALLATALEALQRNPRSAELEPVIEHAAAASSALYGVENDASSLAASQSGVRLASERLGAALNLLQAVETRSGHAQAGAEIVAQAL